MGLRRFALPILLACFSTPAFTQTPPLVVHGPVGLNMSPGCSITAESEPPFLVVNPPLAKQALQAQVNNGNGYTNGYLPEGTVVTVDRKSMPSLTSVGGSLVSVKVMSVPTTELDSGKFSPTAGSISRLGQGTRVKPGALGQVRASDLNSATGSFSRPGGAVGAMGTIFEVKRNTPFFDIPELEGRAVRLAQSGSKYQFKRCCPAGVRPATDAGGFLRYLQDPPRDPRCSYTPVFELLGKTGNALVPLPTVEKQFALDTPNCGNFFAGLAPVSLSNLKMVLSGASMGGSEVAVSDENLIRLQQVAWSDATQARNPRGPGNFSRGKCRTAVRETLQELGWLNAHPPGVAAYELASKDRQGVAWLARNGFRDVTSEYRTTGNAPIGSVLVYKGGPYGHVEMRVDKDSFCSDFCTNRPIDETRDDRELIGIFVPEGK